MVIFQGEISKPCSYPPFLPKNSSTLMHIDWFGGEPFCLCSWEFEWDGAVGIGTELCCGMSPTPPEVPPASP